VKTWLVLDVHYLCHRAFHTSGDLAWKGKSTGVIFGFLKSITFLKDEFQTDRVAFCFEHPHLFRRDVFPGYKRRRAAERTTEEKKALESLAIQISELRLKYLPKIGFKNVFRFNGMESDDIMAAIAENLPEDEEAILVTADADLLQCLRPNVTVYSPQARKVWTVENFTSAHGIPPSKWAVVKAIAGCKSDEVIGIKGVGDISAIKYLRGALPKHTLQYQSIRSPDGRAIVRGNRRLVELPYEGCPVPELVEDNISVQGWREVCSVLGMRSIASHPPIATRKRKEL
jgi:5'-3' exonuclease